MQFREECKHGVIQAQCRCPGLKAVRIVECGEVCTTVIGGDPGSCGFQWCFEHHAWCRTWLDPHESTNRWDATGEWTGDA